MATAKEIPNKINDQDFLEFFSDPAFLVDRKKNILFGNAAFYKQFGVEADKVDTPMSCEGICPTNLCGTPDCPTDKAFRLGKRYQTELVYKADDNITYFKSQATPIGDQKTGPALIQLTDITADKKTQAELNQLRTDLDIIPTPIVEINDTFTITYINPAGAEVVGMPQDKAIGKKCYNLFKTPHCKTDKCACAQAMKTDSVITAETIARPRDGVIIPIKYTGAPIKDAKGNITGALEYVLDMTEEAKQRQDANEKINNLNAIPTPILSTDTEFNITFINPTGAAVLNSTVDQVIGKKCYDLFKTPHCQTDKCALSQAMHTDSIVSAETIARPREGVIIPIKYTGAPIKDAKGNITGALEYVQDMTEEAKQRQDANEKINNLNAIPTPILSIDTEYNITFMNPTGAAVLNMTVDQVMGKKCYDLFKTPHCQTDKCALNQAMRTDAIVSAETIARPRDGVIIPIKYTGAPIKDAKGNITGALEYVQDMTEEAKQRQDANEKINNLNAIPTPILSIDTEYTITFMNPTGAAVLNSTVDQVIGKKCYDLFKTPHCQTDKCALNQAMRTDAIVSADTIARPRDGVIIPIKYTGAPIKDAKGNIIGALEYVQDMTEEAKQRQDANEKINNLNAIPTPILSIDTEFTITFMNPTGAAVLNSTVDQVIGKKCYDLFKTPHCQTDKCALQQAMTTDSIVSAETIARPRDGVIIPIKYTGAPIKDAKGNITGALEYVQDMTEVAKQRQEANEKIDNLNAIPTPILSIDTEYNITFMNPAGAAVLNSTVDQVIGKKCYDLFKTPHCQTDKCALSQAMSTDSIVSAETIARPRDGVIIPIKYTGAPIKDAKGNLKGALEYVQDITEESRQRQEANEKVENLNTIPTPIFSIDTNYTINYINPAGATLVGSNVDELIGRKCYDLFHTEHCRTDKCACGQAMANDEIVASQTIATLGGGKEVPVKYTASPIKDAKGNIKGALEYMVDVTAEAEVERLIVESSGAVNDLVALSQAKMKDASLNMDEMSKLIINEVNLLDNASEKVRHMVSSSSEMLNLSKISTELTKEVNKEADTGKQAGRDASEKLEDINVTMKTNNEMVNDLVNQLEKISGFVDIIKEIASQTNLLAFNAAIEAARAGEAGRGFAVVADEVRKLAENSSKSAVDISNIVKSVENGSRQTISAMQDGMKMLTDGGRVINTALDAMERISTSIDSISSSIDNLKDKADTLSSDGQEVMQQIEQVVSSSQENKASTQTVSESINGTVEALNRLVDSSNSLQESIKNLG